VTILDKRFDEVCPNFEVDWASRDLDEAVLQLVRRGAHITYLLDVEPGCDALGHSTTRDLVGQRDGIVSALASFTGNGRPCHMTWIDVMRMYEAVTRDDRAGQW